MRKEYEQRPIDTKVIRENFHGALERKMNSLMSQGYVPMGGTSTIMNTHARPILKMDVKEYIQTMIKYGNFEIWVKESELDHSAYKSEQEREHLVIQQSRLKDNVEKQFRIIEQLKIDIQNAKKLEVDDRKVLFKSFKDNMNKRQNIKRFEKLQEASKIMELNKLDYQENNKVLSSLTSILDNYYQLNPTITKDILLQSR